MQTLRNAAAIKTNLWPCDSESLKKALRCSLLIQGEEAAYANANANAEGEH